MPQIGIEQLGGNSATPGGGSMWTPKNIGQIITGIKDLMKEYQNLKGVISGGNNQPQTQDLLGSPAKIPPNVVTTPMLKDFVQRFCDTMIQQGNGDKKVGDVLNELPYTISQIRGFLQ